MPGLKSVKTADATLKGVEAMRLNHKRQCLPLRPGVAAETHFFNKFNKARIINNYISPNGLANALNANTNQ